MRLWDSVKAVAAGVEDDGSFDSPAGPEDCQARRAAALTVAAEDLALPAAWGARPYGVVIDVGGASGVTTLVAFATGESSRLAASGSGILGRPSHVHVVLQAKRLVAAAAGHVSSLDPAADFPLPPAGATRFYVLTRDGVLAAGESTEALRSGRSPLSPLLDAGDALMSEFLQYGWADAPVPPPTASDFVKPLAIVAAFTALTYAAWLIPVGWLRWPAVAVGLFFTIAALIVPVAMLAGPRLPADPPDETAASA